MSVLLFVDPVNEKSDVYLDTASLEKTLLDSLYGNELFLSEQHQTPLTNYEIRTEVLNGALKLTIDCMRVRLLPSADALNSIFTTLLEETLDLPDESDENGLWKLNYNEARFIYYYMDEVKAWLSYACTCYILPNKKQVVPFVYDLNKIVA